MLELIQRIIDFFVCKSYVGKYIRGKNHKYYKIITQKKLQRVRKEIRKTRRMGNNIRMGNNVTCSFPCPLRL